MNDPKELRSEGMGNGVLADSCEAIFFDAGGTLLHPYPSVGEIYRDVAAKYGHSLEARKIEDAFMHVWTRHDGMADLVSGHDQKIERAWWKKIVHETFDPLATIEAFDDFFDELYDLFASPGVWRLYPEVIEVLETLRAKKKKMAVISNWDGRLLGLCESLGLNAYFEFVIASAVFGASKPHASIFEQGLKQLGVAPGDALHVGDSLVDDIQGAYQTGMRPVWINRNHRLDALPQTAQKGIIEIKNLRELVD